MFCSLFLLPSVIQCLALQQPTRGSVKCSDHLGPSSYGSTCEFTCDEGYTLVGSSILQCEESGLWSSTQPLCVGMSTFTDAGTQSDFTIWRGMERFSRRPPRFLPFTATQCPILHQLENGAINCGEDADTRFSYGSSCSFTCALGYSLAGPSSATCTSAAEWSEPMPRCEGKFRPTAVCAVFIVDVFFK